MIVAWVLGVVHVMSMAMEVTTNLRDVIWITLFEDSKNRD